MTTPADGSVRTAAQRLRWFRSPTPSGGRSFTDGVLNTCFNAADRQVAVGRADAVALSGPSVADGHCVDLTFAELTAQAAKLAGILRALEVREGDPVLLKLPTSVELVIAMLAVARLGSSYAIDDSPYLTAGFAVAVSDVVLPMAPLLLVRGPHQKPAGDEHQRLDYRSLMKSSAIQPAECVEVPATAPLRLGRQSTGNYLPLCDNGAHAVALAQVGAGLELSTADLDPGTGHPCLAYAPLLVGCASVLP
ncbi:MAG: propionyl-CoA synthetase [Pseudonocardiales bacterium]|nr:propionyl-CoA synthetase [Pseudonocardiales bacterium]